MRYGDSEATGKIKGRKQKGLSLFDVFRLIMPEDPPMPGTLWTWRGPLTKIGGYGQITHANRTHLAHRVSYRLFVGPIPGRLHILHQYDTPADVNPHNLRAGTPADNTFDKVSRGRQARGTMMPNAILNDDTVRHARLLYGQGHAACDLARKFGVTQSSMGSALRGDTWKHVV